MQATTTLSLDKILPTTATYDMQGKNVDFIGSPRKAVLIFIIEDHPLMREALRILIAEIQSSTKIVELTRLGDVELELSKNGTPDLFILDLNLPDSKGVSTLKKLRRICQEGSIMIVTGTEDEDCESMCLAAGADSYTRKSDGVNEIYRRLNYHLLKYSYDNTKDTIMVSLTRRQLEVLKMVSTGLTNTEISEKLNISDHTVKVHIYHLLNRMGVKNRNEAAYMARKLKLFG